MARVIALAVKVRHRQPAFDRMDILRAAIVSGCAIALICARAPLPL